MTGHKLWGPGERERVAVKIGERAGSEKRFKKKKGQLARIMVYWIG